MRNLRRFSGRNFLALLLLTILLSVGCDRADAGSSTSSDGKPLNSSAPTVSDALKPGDPPPNFELVDLSGRKRTLADYRGRVVLLNFWATWCGPCVAEMPSFERLYQTYRDKGFEIVAINADVKDRQPNVEKFVKENGLSFSVLLDPSLDIPPRFNVQGFPESFLIGRDGKLLAVKDPETKHTLVRFVSDRPWDSPAFLKLIGEIVEQK